MVSPIYIYIHNGRRCRALVVCSKHLEDKIIIWTVGGGGRVVDKRANDLYAHTYKSILRYCTDNRGDDTRTHARTSWRLLVARCRPNRFATESYSYCALYDNIIYRTKCIVVLTWPVATNSKGIRITMRRIKNKKRDTFLLCVTFTG